MTTYIVQVPHSDTLDAYFTGVSVRDLLAHQYEDVTYRKDLIRHLRGNVAPYAPLRPKVNWSYAVAFNTKEGTAKVMVHAASDGTPYPRTHEMYFALPNHHLLNTPAPLALREFKETVDEPTTRYAAACAMVFQMLSEMYLAKVNEPLRMVIASGKAVKLFDPLEG